MFPSTATSKNKRRFDFKVNISEVSKAPPESVEKDFYDQFYKAGQESMRTLIIEA